MIFIKEPRLQTCLDYTGNSFRLGSYTRIVSLVPSITELLFDLGLEESIVGVTNYCVNPANARDSPRVVVGGTKNPDVEIIESLKPDLVIINKEENRVRHYSMLLERNISVFVTYPRTLHEALTMIEQFIKLFCVDFRPALTKLAKLHALVKKIVEQTATITIKKRVFCPIWKNPWMSINSDTFISNLIETCGGYNVFSNASDRYPKITMEAIKELKPEIIILPTEPFKFTESHIKELQSHPEFKTSKIIILDGKFHWYSFSLNQTLPKLFFIMTGKKLFPM